MIELRGLGWILAGAGDGQVQQQLVALRVGLRRAVRQPQLQQRFAPCSVALTHLQAAQFGAGVGIAGPGRQVLLHRLAQPGCFVASGQQFGPVAVVEQGRHGAIGDAPVGFALQEGHHAVVHHRVVGPAPVDGRMAAEQPAHAGIGRLGCPQLLAQQIDHQQIGLCHQLAQRLFGGFLQQLIRIEHQHPVALHVLKGLVARRGEIPGPGHGVHHRPAALGDGHGGVLGAGVEQHHLINKPRHGGQAGLQPLGLIAHDHREAQHGQWRRGIRSGSLKGLERVNR